MSSILHLVLLGVFLSASAFGQTSGSLGGVVQDPQGSGGNRRKGYADRSQENSDPSGDDQFRRDFAFPGLQPGEYTVTVEATGFKKSVKSGIVINVNDRQSTGVISLEIGGVGDVVQITADAAQMLLKTESAEQSQVINSEQVENLALNGRNYLDLVKLTPGVVSFVNGQTAGPGGLGSFNINGTRANQLQPDDRRDDQRRHRIEWNSAHRARARQYRRVQDSDLELSGRVWPFGRW
jgi:hypothetical protein